MLIQPIVPPTTMRHLLDPKNECAPAQHQPAIDLYSYHSSEGLGRMGCEQGIQAPAEQHEARVAEQQRHSEAETHVLALD